MAIRSWIRKLFARTPRTVRKAPARFRPRLETLEDRLVPTGNATHLQVSAPSSVSAGAPFGMTLEALDEFGNDATNYTGTVHFTTTDSGSSVVLPADYTFVAADRGVHTFSNGVKLVTAGAQTVSATDTFTSSITGTTNTINVFSGAATHFTVTAPSTGTAGSPFTITVMALDEFGNDATNYTGTVHFTTTDSGSSVVLPADYTFIPGENGVHTFSNGVTLVTAGAQTVTATDSSSVTGTSTSIAVADLRNAVFSNLLSPSIVYGTATTTLSGHLADGSYVPLAGETVSITISGVTRTANLNGSGDFSVAFPTAMLGVASSPYTVTYAYGGDSTFRSASDSSTTLTVLSWSQATAALKDQVDTAGLADHLTDALDNKLEAAIDSFDKGKTKAGANHLEAFIDRVTALRGQGIDAALAKAWIDAAQEIIDAVG
jgi:hypothetical protein